MFGIRLRSLDDLESFLYFGLRVNILELHLFDEVVVEFDESVLYSVHIFGDALLVLSYTLNRESFTSTETLRFVLMRSTAISMLKVVGLRFLEFVLASSRTNLRGLVLRQHTCYLCFLCVYSTQAQQQSMLF